MWRAAAFLSLASAKGVTAQLRVTAMEALLATKKNISNVPPQSIGHFYSGSKGKQHLSKASYIELTSDDVARSFFAAAGGTGKVATSSHGPLALKPSKTRVDLGRGWALRKAEELVKAACNKGETVQSEFGKGQCVAVNGTRAFA